MVAKLFYFFIGTYGWLLGPGLMLENKHGLALDGIQHAVLS
jgi:hypothetical protein